MGMNRPARTAPRATTRWLVLRTRPSTSVTAKSPGSIFSMVASPTPPTSSLPSSGRPRILAGFAVMTLVTAGWGWYSNSQKAKIASINNTENGVKVVSAASPSPQVDAPLK